MISMHTSIVIAGLVVMLAVLGSEVQAQPRVDLELHAEPTAALRDLRVQHDDGTAFDATHTDAGWLALAILLVDGWRTDVDLIGVTADGRRSMFLSFTLNTAGRRYRTTFHHHGAGQTTLKDAGHMERLIGCGDEESLLEAYARGREGCEYWWEKNRRHRAGMRACKAWFDAAYQLARERKWPYRMDEQARKRMEDYEREVAPNCDAYQQIVRPGYISGMLHQLDALAFQDASLVESLRLKGDYELALKVNEHVLRKWESTPSERRAMVTEVQGVNTNQLISNRQYLLTLLGRN